MTKEQIMDRIIEIIESDIIFDDEVRKEWKQLNDDLRAADGGEPCYGLGFWHNGYEIFLHGSKILYSKMSEEQYSDMLDSMSSMEKIKAYNEKWCKD